MNETYIVGSIGRKKKNTNNFGSENEFSFTALINSLFACLWLYQESIKNYFHL